jgi:hypothetical protein
MRIGQAGAVVALDEEPGAAQTRGQVGHVLERRRRVAEARPGQLAEASEDFGLRCFQERHAGFA